MHNRSVGPLLNPFGCPVTQGQQAHTFAASGIKFYCKDTVEKAPARVSTPASSRGYLVGVSLEGNHKRSIINGRGAREYELGPGSVYIRRFEDSYQADLDGAFSYALLEIPRSGVLEIAESADVPQVTELDCVIGETDAVLHSLLKAVLPQPGSTPPSALFFEQIGLAIGFHLLNAYGASGTMRRSTSPSALSPAMLRRAKEAMCENLRTPKSIADLSKICDISAASFIRSFKQSTGLSPHQWLIETRLERARDMLSDGKHMISEVAKECGYNDSAHFSRSFSARFGETPSRWRRGIH